ncbi:MAG: metallophosphoesterase [Bacillota bacterium]|nr:metallophosphoesterase [Bacillota bacterium]
MVAMVTRPPAGGRAGHATATVVKRPGGAATGVALRPRVANVACAAHAAHAVRAVRGARAAATWVLVTFACIYAAINLFGHVSYHVAGLDIRISARIGFPGYSRLAIPPIGRVEARTHLTPLQLEAALENIDPGMLQDAISRGEAPSSIGLQFKRDSGRLVTAFALRVALLAIAGGAFGAGAASGWRFRPALVGALVGLAVSSALLGITYVSFDERRLANPRYEGVIEAAPWMLGLLDGSLLKAGEVAGSMETIAANIRTLFDRAEAFHQLESDTPFVRVLHVSDIHDNPQAFDFLAQVVKSFKPDLIIDTGDITDFGTVPEARMAAGRVRALGIPYVFVPGNHDSPAVGKVMSAEGGAILLDDGVADLRGIRIVALADPGSLRPDMAPASPEELDRARAHVEALIGSTGDRPGRVPDVLAVHDLRVAERAVGRVPVVLCGHDHHLSAVLRDGTAIIDAGTTGGAGIRGLQVEGGVPMSVSLLHFAVEGPSGRPDGGGAPRLVAVDTIRILGERQGFDLERRLVRTSDAGRVWSEKILPAVHGKSRK